MGKIKFLFIFLIIFLCMGYVKAERQTGFSLGSFLENCSKDSNNQCVFSELNTHQNGYVDVNKIVFCLDKTKNAQSGSNYTYEGTTTGEKEACAVWNAVNSGYFKLPEKEGTYYLRNFYNTTNDTTPDGETEVWSGAVQNTSEIQWAIWNESYITSYNNHNISSSNCIITEGSETVGNLSVQKNIFLEKKTIGTEQFFTGTINVNHSNLTNNNSYNINAADGVIISETEDGTAVSSSNSDILYVRIPESEITSSSNFSVSFTGSSTNSATTTYTPIMDRYVSGDYQPMGILGVVVDKTSRTVELEINTKLILDNTKVIISKKSATDSKELPGATLQILDSNKEVISCKIINSDGEEEELEDCKWISKDKPVNVVGLGEGQYFLKEITAPKGYAVNESMIEFEVKYGETSQVEMVDELEVNVPDTLSTRSAMIIAIAMFDIAFGIGLINYVKKTKTAK